VIEIGAPGYRLREQILRRYLRALAHSS